MNKPLTLGSLFDGIGGFPLAGSRAGFEPLWASEIEAFPQRVSSHHFPRMIHFGDIKGIHGALIPPVDVITFGSPCQNLSVAGKREGLAGERSGLFFEAIRIIKEMRDATNGEYPQFALWENVPGAFSSNEGEDFKAVIQSFADIGALDVAWRIFDAQHSGVPQRRRRIVLIADFAGERADEILFESEGVRGYSPPSRKTRQGITQALTGGSASRPDDNRAQGGFLHVEDVARCDTTREGRSNDEGSDTLIAFAQNQRDELRILEVAGALAAQPGMKQQTFLAFDARNMAETGDVTMTLQAKSNGGISLNMQPLLAFRASEQDGFEPGEIAPPLLSSDGGGVVPTIAFTCKDYGADAGEISPTLRAMGYDKSHLGGGGQVAVAFGPNDSLHNGGTFREDGISPSLRAMASSGQGSVAIAYALQHAQIGRSNDAGPQGKGWQEDVSFTMDSRPTADAVAGPNMRVRRLTPLECERLQGFPDSWSDIPDAKGKPAADLRRYAALGNSIAVPVFEWVLRRMAATLKED